MTAIVIALDDEREDRSRLLLFDKAGITVQRTLEHGPIPVVERKRLRSSGVAEPDYLP